MAKYPRRSLFARIRSFRWWLVTYGSIKTRWWFLRTPPFSLLMFAAGFATGVWFVLRYIPCP